MKNWLVSTAAAFAAVISLAGCPDKPATPPPATPPAAGTTATPAAGTTAPAPATTGG